MIAKTYVEGLRTLKDIAKDNGVSEDKVENILKRDFIGPTYISGGVGYYDRKIQAYIKRVLDNSKNPFSRRF
jgi:hypothetical protein